MSEKHFAVIALVPVELAIKHRAELVKLAHIRSCRLGLCALGLEIAGKSSTSRASVSGSVRTSSTIFSIVFMVMFHHAIILRFNHIRRRIEARPSRHLRRGPFHCLTHRVNLQAGVRKGDAWLRVYETCGLE